MNNAIKYAEEWFKLQDIPTIYDKETLYVIVGGHFELELSSEEINYRAELYLDYELYCLKRTKTINNMNKIKIYKKILLEKLNSKPNKKLIQKLQQMVDYLKKIKK